MTIESRLKSAEKALKAERGVERCYTYEQILRAAWHARGAPPPLGQPLGPPEGIRKPGEPTIEELLLKTRNRALARTAAQAQPPGGVPEDALSGKSGPPAP